MHLVQRPPLGGTSPCTDGLDALHARVYAPGATWLRPIDPPAVVTQVRGLKELVTAQAIASPGSNHPNTRVCWRIMTSLRKRGQIGTSTLPSSRA